MIKQVCIKLTEAQYNHFLSLVEREGCKSLPEMLRKAAFIRWPMNKSKDIQISTTIPQISTTIPQISTDIPQISTAIPEISQATKAPKQESFPHTPFKEYNNNKKNISNACAREEKLKKPKSAEPKFVPPTLDEVREYIAAKGYTFDAEHFWSFYTAKGWRVGSHVMKSWHAACTTWQKNSDQRNKTEAIRQAYYDAKMDEREAVRQAHIDARFDKRDAAREAKQNAAASASSNSRYYNGRLKLSNHVDISEEERNDLLKDFFA